MILMTFSFVMMTMNVKDVMKEDDEFEEIKLRVKEQHIPILMFNLNSVKYKCLLFGIKLNSALS